MLADKDEVNPVWIPTKDMSRVGKEIVKICFADEDKPGKVARRVLELLHEEAKRQNKAREKARLKEKPAGYKSDE